MKFHKMFKNTYQSGFLSILYSIGSKPLQIWDKQSNLYFIQLTTDTLNDLRIRIFNLQSYKSWERMLRPLLLPVLKTKLKHSELNYPFSSWLSRMYALDHSAKKIFHLRSASSWWQKCPKKVQSIKLSVYNSSETFYMHHAYEIGWRMESDSV